MTATCPRGHVSVEDDYCSVCGSPIGSARAETPPGAQVAVAVDADVCPDCGTPRSDASARYCEVCRHDFVDNVAGEGPLVAPTPEVSNEAESPPPAASVPTEVVEAPAPSSPATSAVAWDVCLRIDPTLDLDKEPGVDPPDEPERRLPLDEPEALVGRRDDQRGIFPHIVPHDPGVSRRHARLALAPDGSLTIVDLESANGTYVNGEQLVSGVPRAITDADEVTLGRWTRLRLCRRISE